MAQTAFPRKTDKPKREVWLHERCKQLKHQAGAVDNLITEMEKFAKRTQLSKTVKENLTATQTYFANNHQRMNYAGYVAQDLPTGSGCLQNLGEAAFVLLRNAVETARSKSNFVVAGINSIERAMGIVLG